jgi:hypothetical protein
MFNRSRRAGPLAFGFVQRLASRERLAFGFLLLSLTPASKVSVGA